MIFVAKLFVRLRVSALEQKLAALHVHRDAEWRQEFVTDDATELEPQEDAGSAQIQDDQREIPVLDFIEIQVLTWHQKRVAIPSRRSPHAQRDTAEWRRGQRARRLGADGDHLATGVDHEVGRDGSS